MAPENERAAGLIQNLAMIDLSGKRSREECAGMRLRNVGVVLVPEDLPDLLATADCENIGAMVPVPHGTRVESHTGQVEMAGATLAAGDGNTILLLVGQVVVTPEVTEIGYRGLVLVGQVILPKSAQSAIAGKIVTQTGHVFYYEGADPRVYMEDVRFTAAFLDLVEEPMNLILLGDSTFAADVTPELLRRKVRHLALIGDATVENPDLQPLLQYMAKPAAGSIAVVSAGDGTAP